MGLWQTLRFITGHPLNKDRKAWAVRRFLQWQVGSRLLSGPVALPFVNDARLLVARGMLGATGNVYTGLHEFQDMSFVLHALRKSDLFVDVGANVGTYTVLAGKSVGATCIAIEPSPDTFLHLLDNLRLNGIESTTTPHNLALAEEAGAVAFTTGLDTTNHLVPEGTGSVETIQVAVRTLDDLVEDAEPLVLKIDVEGFETSVVRGGRRVLGGESPRAVIMELNGSGAQFGFNECTLHEVMMEMGYAPFVYAPFERELTLLSGKNQNSGNTLYVRDKKFFAERLRSARSFDVEGRLI